jgi:hypothetical protein
MSLRCNAKVGGNYSKRGEYFYIVIASDPALAGERGNLVYLGIVEFVPSKARNLWVCFGFASQPFHSSQRHFT